MLFQPGSILKGARATYKLQQVLKNNTVFKAQVIDSSHIDSKWAVIKTSSTDLERYILHTEFNYYHQIPTIKQSPYIRRLYEGVGSFFYREYRDDEPPEKVNHDHFLVFEWMDQDLWHTPSAPFRGGDSQFPKIVSKSILEALAVFRELGAAHTDINPNNILISGLESNKPVVKVADLGMLRKEGRKAARLQCLPCRAPEVWKGLGVYHSSDIWSVGVTLTNWLYRKHGLFGAGEKYIDGHTEAWCIAMIQLLVGPMGDYNGEPEFADEFADAEALASAHLDPPIGKLMKYKTLRDELRHMNPPVASDIIDFIESLLIIDPSKRPTAEQALRHPFLESLKETKTRRGK